LFCTTTYSFLIICFTRPGAKTVKKVQEVEEEIDEEEVEDKHVNVVSEEEEEEEVLRPKKGMLFTSSIVLVIHSCSHVLMLMFAGRGKKKGDKEAEASPPLTDEEIFSRAIAAANIVATNPAIDPSKKRQILGQFVHPVHQILSKKYTQGWEHFLKSRVEKKKISKASCIPVHDDMSGFLSDLKKVIWEHVKTPATRSGE
jgi:hypothetical protein